jgi:hypothetical protein
VKIDQHHGFLRRHNSTGRTDQADQCVPRLDTDGEADECPGGAMKPWHRHLKRILWIAALCLCLPVFYVLGIGPAQFICTRFHLADRTIVAMRAFYSPLKKYADNHGDRFEVELLVSYIDFWQGNY